MRITYFSFCRQYRYTLWRCWDVDNAAYVVFVGLNPSTADERSDDPTVRRCVRFAKAWGYGSLCMLNLFAYRSPKPGTLKQVASPVGAENDFYIKKCSENANRIVACWGTQGSLYARDREVVELLGDNLFCLGQTKDGHPKHPLYVKANKKPQVYSVQKKNALT